MTIAKGFEASSIINDLRVRGMSDPVVAILREHHTTSGEVFVERLRTAHVTRARHAIFWTLHQPPYSVSFPGIGAMLGFDHSTVFYGARKHERMIAAVRRVA